MTGTGSFTRRASAPAALLALVALLATAAVGRAQLPSIAGGTHVRVSAGQPSVVSKGTLFSQTPDTLRISDDGIVRVIPVASIDRIQVGSGRSHSAGTIRGMKVGTLILGGASAVIFTAAYASYNGEKHPQELLGYIAGGAIGGAVYGALIGAAVGTESWTTVYPARVGVSVAPSTIGGGRLGVSLAF